MTFSRIVEVASTGSTNTDLLRALDAEPEMWPHLAVLVAAAQTEGRGRGGRPWIVTPGTALTCSVVIAADAAPLTWVPLLVGVAVRRAVQPWLETELKWPNDVLLTHSSPAEVSDDAEPSPAAAQPWGWAPKVAGILCERHSSGAIVAGIGVNCRQSRGELPVPWAASIASATGMSGPAPAEVLERLALTLPTVLDEWSTSPNAIRAEYEASSAILGRNVRVTGAGPEIVGRVVGFGRDGSLLVDVGTDSPAEILAGDVEHVR